MRTWEPFAPETQPENWPKEYVSLSDHEAQVLRLKKLLEKAHNEAAWVSPIASTEFKTEALSSIVRIISSGLKNKC